MNELHVGRGTTRGAMTVFPLWGQAGRYRRYTIGGGSDLDVTEVVEDGPRVDTLMVDNPGDRPALVLEGTLFEGGWQHRMACHSVMVGVHQRIPVEVACVEQGRWGGTSRQNTKGRRATPYVRDSGRRGGDVQGEVWNRVAVHTQDVGVPTPGRRLSHSDLHWVRHTPPPGNPTASFVHRLDRAQDERKAWSSLRALPGQIGVLIGISGQPYIAEVFDFPSRLRRQLPGLLEAAALDARGMPTIATPSRRAHRFIDRLEHVKLTQVAPAGVAERFSGANEYADMSRLRWQGQDVHARMTNVNHPMLAG
ncbi:DUF6569 family protein [Janibacter sp. DB-40]|uniref:ARPP-1 family domain-containing protein n=1 Tax=Janibacter sp. DB-40 TaxID=3028808 RepID=UPI00240556F7|nr:DUF6569 family protein [Janibacter sp. DB-40]